jgi:hypothetical protein
MLWVEMDKKSLHTSKNTVVGTIYRRPGSDPLLFNAKLQEILTKIDKEKKNAYTQEIII